jgi:4-amino-4-deoxy-L-arabinose transferase-like glycosyltransferase
VLFACCICLVKNRLFFIIFAVSFAIRLTCYTGLIGSDDLFYSLFAQDIASGRYELEAHHMAIRYGVLLPVASFYKLFGQYEWTTIAVPLVLSSLAPALTSILAFHLFGLRAAWITGLLLSSFPVEVRYASILVPEPILQTVLLGGATLFVLASKRESVALAFLSGFVFGLGYLVKEPAAFVIAAFFLYALVRGKWWIAGAMATGAAMILLGEVMWYWFEAGDLLFRHHAMAAHNKSGMAVAANESLYYRLFKSYPRIMILPNIDYGLHSVFALAGGAIALLGYRCAATPLLCLWAALPWLYLNFGSSSFEYYWALPVAPRYISLVYTPLFLLTAMVIASWANTRTKELAALTVLIVVTSVGIICALMTRKTGYNINEVIALKNIVSEVRAGGKQICQVTGQRANRWRRTLELVGSDVMGCSSENSVMIDTDDAGVPKLKEERCTPEYD